MAKPTAKQLHRTAEALRKDGHHEAAAHFATHADVVDQAAAFKALANHIDKLADEDLAVFNRSDVLDDHQLSLVCTEINVASLSYGAAVLLAGCTTDSAADARNLAGVAPDAAVRDVTEPSDIERLVDAVYAQTAALLAAIAPAAEAAS